MHSPCPRVRGMGLVGLAGLSIKRNGCTPAHGDGTDIRATVCVIHARWDRWRRRSERPRIAGIEARKGELRSATLKSSYTANCSDGPNVRKTAGAGHEAAP